MRIHGSLVSENCNWWSLQMSVTVTGYFAFNCAISDSGPNLETEV